LRLWHKTYSCRKRERGEDVTSGKAQRQRKVEASGYETHQKPVIMGERK